MKCENEKCGRPFEAAKSYQKFCSKKCKGLVRGRSAERKEYMKDRASEARLLVLDFKRTHPCVDCEESDPVCLDFHHRDPSQKSFVIGHQYAQRSRERMQIEIDKCDVLCANCHRKRHAKENALQALVE